jgi:hypothetical protein
VDIFTIWVNDSASEPWAIGCWDAPSIDMNDEGYDAAIADAERIYGKDHVRIIKSTIDYDAVTAAFQPRVDAAAVTGAEPVDAR